MNDLLSIARRMEERARGATFSPDLDQEDFLSAADALRAFNAVLNAKSADNPPLSGRDKQRLS